MRVVVAEKPSVARDLARVLGATQRHNGYLEGNGLCITWCFGHMAELEEPAHYDPAWRRWALDALPMLPHSFDVKLRDGAKDQFSVIAQLLGRAEDVVNACDAGREGELIFRWVMEMARCQAPVLRLWVSSLTDAAIQAGWSKLRPGSDFDRLGDAARCRSESDWLVGLNATRALTCRSRDEGGGQLLSVGRVQTPTLAMIVARDREIEAFVPEDFWQVKATFEADVPGELRQFEATWFRTGDPSETKGEKADSDEVSHAERLPEEAQAQQLVDATRGQPGRVASAERKRISEPPPLLYDLTSLQRRANQRYGLSADKTLAVAQALYETHKLITYPRTDARFLTPDQVPTLPDAVKGLLPIPVYQPFAHAILQNPIQPGKRVVNPAEVGDHHAILPTGRTPSSGLSPDEKRVFDLVARRFLAALSDDALFDVSRLVVEVEPSGPIPADVPAPLTFRARGRICRREGWRAVDPPKSQKQVELPAVDVDDVVDTIDARSVAGQTRPPRPHNDASILKDMETAGRKLDDRELARAMRGCGLGTPATRAAILTVLVDRAYVVRKGKELRATEKGCALIDAVPIDALKSPELTGRWEGKLSELADGKGRRADFMAEVRAWVEEMVAALATAELTDAAKQPPDEKKPIGSCPACGKPVRDRGPVFACDTGRACAFVVFKTMAKRKISARTVKQLLSTGRSELLKGFKSKKGTEFSAGLQWDAAASKVSFWFEERRDDAPAPTPPAPRSPEPKAAPRRARTKVSPPKEGGSCPKCGQGTVIRGRIKLGCSRWREGCDWTGPP